MIRQFAKHWAYSNFNIATAGLCYALSTCLVYKVEPIYMPFLLLVFCATLSNYVFHRAYPVIIYQFKSHTNSIFNWTIEHLHFLKITFLIAVVLLTITFFMLNFFNQVILVSLALLTLLYSLPIIKNKGSRKRLRDVGYLKIALIGFTWALVCGNLPLIHCGQSYDFMTHISVFAEKFLFIVAITIPFDIRDMEYDKSVGVTTLPIRLGITKATLFALFCLFLSLIVVSFQIISNDVKIAYGFTYVLAACLILESTTKQENFYYLFYIDGLMILLLSLIVLFKMLLC